MLGLWGSLAPIVPPGAETPKLSTESPRQLDFIFVIYQGYGKSEELDRKTSNKQSRAGPRLLHIKTDLSCGMLIGLYYNRRHEFEAPAHLTLKGSI